MPQLRIPSPCVAVVLMAFVFNPSFSFAQIVADHNAVAQYRQIPAAYIELVKKMWLNVPGESHSFAYRRGMTLLASQESAYAAVATESGSPAAYTDKNLRVNRLSWGDLTHATGWVAGYGEEDWFTSATAVERTKAHLTYCNTNNLAIAAMGFGWCWDMTSGSSPGGTIDPVHLVRWAGATSGGPEGSMRWGLDAEDTALTGNSVCMDTYLSVTQQYADFCRANGYPTKVFFTTGPVDGSGNTGENGYQRQLKHEHIRKYVRASSDRILFDYADILCWGDDGTEKTVTWKDSAGNTRTYPFIHPNSLLALDGTPSEAAGHIGERGALRIAKAMWWMLARIAGWDGKTTDITQVPVAASEGTTQLVNLSTRGLAAAGENALIGGFVLSGTSSAKKTLLIRGVGPTLTTFGLASAQVLQKPVMTLFDGAGKTLAVRRTQDLIVGGVVDSSIQAAGVKVSAFELKNWGGTTAGDAALLADLAPGSYTVSIAPDADSPVGAAGAASGLVLLEIYDVTRTDGARLVNLSTRGRATTGDQQLIAGFVVEGSGVRRLLLRGVGPALGAFGVTQCLSDTALTLVSGAGATLASNNDWSVSSCSAQAGLLGSTIGAFALPAQSADAALLHRLSAGRYSMLVGPGAGDSSGVCLVEIYETP